MKIIYNDLLNKELIDYLISQDGIKNVEIIKENKMNGIIIDTNINPTIVAKYIDLYLNEKWSTMFAFDKENSKNIIEYKFIATDICCEYCHMHFIRELFENDNIIKVDSNYSLNNSSYNIEYIIYYNDKYKEKELLEYINKSI